MDVDLYLLLPSLKPCEPVDSLDTRLNQSYSLIVNPLRKSLSIELYNETWFDKLPRSSKPLFEYDHPALTFPECSPTSFLSVSNLHDDSKTPCAPPLIEQNPDIDILCPLSPFVLCNSLSNYNGFL